MAIEHPVSSNYWMCLFIIEMHFPLIDSIIVGGVVVWS